MASDTVAAVPTSWIYLRGNIDDTPLLQCYYPDYWEKKTGKLKEDVRKAKKPPSWDGWTAYNVRVLLVTGNFCICAMNI